MTRLLPTGTTVPSAMDAQAKKMKDSDAFDEDDNEPNAGEEFAKIVRGCNDTASMLPMNMGLSVNKYQYL